MTVLAEPERPIDVTTTEVSPPKQKKVFGAVKFTGITKRFPDGTQALAPVDLNIGPGEFVTVVGPSGCGKSTLLRVASGLTKATDGKVEVIAEHIGYVFQDPTLLPWRTVRRNVELLMELDGVSRKERRVRAQAAIDLVGLSGAESKYPRALSGGMKMRVSLARCLTMSPEVMLFDEPFAALDEITRERMNDEVLRLFRERQFCGLFITHSVSEAVFMSSRVVVMSGRPGRIIEEFDIPFDYPRSPDLRYSPEFAKVAGLVSAALKAGHS
jgi:NitT/TauT family transport system ATP-binding protein